LGYNLNFHSANFQLLQENCPTCIPVPYGNNTGGGLAFGGLFEYLIFKNQQPTPMRIGVRIGYTDLFGSHAVEENIGNQPPTGDIAQ
jgi:hypothetical protein